MQMIASVLGLILFMASSLMLSSFSGATSKAPYLEISASQSHYVLTPYQSFLQNTDQAHYEDVNELSNSVWQQSTNAPHLGVNLTQWVRIPIQINAPKTDKWLLEVGWPNFSYIDWYLKDQATGKLIDHQVPAQSTQNDQLSFPISLPSTGSYMLYIKVVGHEKIILPLALKTLDIHDQEIHIRSLLTGLFYGVLCAMLFYNLSLYAFTHESNYGAYCLYVISIIFYTLSTSSHYISFLHGHFDWFDQYAYRISVPIAFLSAAIFIRKFLLLSERNDATQYVSKVAILIWTMIFLMTPIMPATWQIWIIDIFAFTSCVVGLWISSFVWYKGDPSGKYITIAWTPLMIATFVLMMGLTNIISFSMNLYYLQNIAFTVEVLLISTALAERINRERQEREEAQAQSIYYEQRSVEARQREITAQQHAIEVERTAKENLEQQVAEQTSELKLAMYSLTQANTELEIMSQTDGLTNLINRRHFDRKFTEAFDRAIDAKWMMAILMLDIDFFKKVNDQHGHQAGDQCLRDISAIFQGMTDDKCDLCARYGGEEFCIVLPNRTKEQAYDIAESIRQAVAEKEIRYGGEMFHVTISIGLYNAVPKHHSQRDKFLKHADEALYMAKRNGRNQVAS
ncbi:sensor domain-containing diguanylate cyclase [Marinomonas ostreistagni]|uniref:diguanylate cyclase n=1 Tax=Marinomonas ostreistagni TaxID=359209 RepID=A0ABS0ZEZ6_9GAMM|nr:diguanylate cyclase [Marinomonas ostreistagni]MBJ7552187.1 diguanylate cyclase [Marinomonas ostreistagni]